MNKSFNNINDFYHSMNDLRVMVDLEDCNEELPVVRPRKELAMPCSDWPYDEISNLKDENRKKIDDISEKLNKAERHSRQLEACLCALFNELISRGLADEVIPAASANGAVDLAKFWLIHNEHDAERLKKELDKFSEHEKLMIKKILSEEEDE